MLIREQAPPMPAPDPRGWAPCDLATPGRGAASCKTTWTQSRPETAHTPVAASVVVSEHLCACPLQGTKGVSPCTGLASKLAEVTVTDTRVAPGTPHPRVHSLQTRCL